MAKPEFAANHEAFLKAYDEQSDAIFRHCYFRCYDREKAQELMQETFMRTWERLVAGEKIENIRAFLYRVAGNLVIDHARKKKSDSLEAMTDFGFEPVGTGAAQIEDAVEASRVVALLGRLDEKYREAVSLRYIDGLSPKEIGALLGESENAVSVRIHRGLALLREQAS